MRNKRSFALLLCAAAALFLLACGCSKGENTSSSVSGSSSGSQSGDVSAAGGTASQLGSLKSFTAQTLAGESFTHEDLAAKDITVVNVWALTCRPCIAELPDLAAFAKALPDNVQMITVCLDGSGNEEITQSILEQAGFEGATLISGDGDLAALCGNLIYTPTTLLVDSGGNLVGDPIVGIQKDLSASYLAAVNAALTAEGKAEISLEA